nr:MAG TPA: hypothetical protein [Caudoviricetes sp.]
MFNFRFDVALPIKIVIITFFCNFVSVCVKIFYLIYCAD